MKLPILLLFLGFGIIATAQENGAKSGIGEFKTPLGQYDNLIKKSKNQKTAAKAFLYTGIGLGAAGSVLWLYSNNIKNDPNGDDWAGFLPGIFGRAFVGVGLAAMASSIPFFIASKRTYRKAIQIQPGAALQHIMMSNQTIIQVPSFSFKIKF